MSIVPYVCELRRQRKDAEVWIDGKKKPSTSIDKEIRRQLSARPELATATPGGLPTGVIVKECFYSPMPLITTELPFHIFEKHLQRNLPPFAERYLKWGQTVSTIGHQIAEPGSWIADGSIEKALQPVVPGNPSAEDDIDFSLIDPGTFFASPLHRNILFSVANNFAGIGSFPKEQVISFLQRETSEVLYRMIRSAPHYYATQAIALNLFRAAIEVGDVTAVEFLLKEDLPGITVNGFICSYLDNKYTPVERAAGLHHTNLVKALLRHGADINLSDSRSGSHGAFDCAVSHMGYKGMTDRLLEFDPELFKVLVYAGAQIEYHTLRDLCKHDSKGDFTRLLISVQAAENPQKWSEQGHFHTIFKYQSHQVCSDTLDMMLKHTVDLNYQVQPCYDQQWRSRVINLVARRGDLLLMQRLIDEGVLQTGDTLPCAIKSGNEDLVCLLLQHGGDVNSMGELRISPLAATIRLQHDSMNNIIVGMIVPSTLSNREMFQSALSAASEVGDLKWIKELIHSAGDVYADDLGSALTIAVQNGKREVALALIDAGADTKILGRPVLIEALLHQDSVLVHALLNADANPNYDSGNQPAIELAVRWGDIEIVKAIIRAGADVNACCSYNERRSALNTAVEKKDYGLCDLLLKENYDVNNPQARTFGKTALKATLETADVAMVEYVLAQGADVHDPDALVMASKRNQQIFDILLDEHNARYPKGRPGWGTEVLYSAIKSADFGLFEKLLDRGANANSCGLPTPFRNGYDLPTPFGYAIYEQRATDLKFVEYLLREQRRTGCTPESIVWNTAWKRSGNPPLEMVTAFLAAIETKSRPMIDLMLRYHAKVDFPATYGVKRTPLQKATELGSMEIIELLLDKGANVNSPAAQRGGGTALQFAAMGGYIPIARRLLELGAEVDAPASKVNGRTALEGAAWMGRLDMVTVLLKAGAAQRGTDHGQIERAIEFAEENGHSYICRQLIKYQQTKTLSSAQDVFEEFIDYDMTAQNSFEELL